MQRSTSVNEDIDNTMLVRTPWSILAIVCRPRPVERYVLPRWLQSFVLLRWPQSSQSLCMPPCRRSKRCGCEILLRSDLEPETTFKQFLKDKIQTQDEHLGRTECDARIPSLEVSWANVNCPWAASFVADTEAFAATG